MKKYFQLLRLGSHKIYPQIHQSQKILPSYYNLEVNKNFACVFFFHMHFLNEVQLFQGFIRNTPYFLCTGGFHCAVSCPSPLKHH